jgi:Flp pilus assembly CpaE family ATPase
MSVYRFKSRETGDLVMLKQHGQRMLEILSKDPSGPGIIQPAEMSGAVQAIRAAVAEDEAHRKEEDSLTDEASPNDTVSLRMRSAPFIEMLQRCEKAGVDIVWGV